MAQDKWQNRLRVNNVRRFMQVHFRWAGIKLDRKFSIHTLREPYGRNQATAGVPIKTLQYLMGHEEDKSTLAHYAQVDAGQAAISANATDRLRADAQRQAPEKEHQQAERLDTHLTCDPVPDGDANPQRNQGRNHKSR